MQKNLSALVVHDIKNALALLELDLEQLNHHAGLPDEARKAYHRCIELRNRLISFLTLYKDEQGRLQPSPREVYLQEFLEDLVGASQSVMLAGHKHGRDIGVTVVQERIKIAPEVKLKGVAYFDEYLLDMALESALNNAVRYAHQRVEIWFEQTPDILKFCVLDDGPGVDGGEDILQRAIPEHSSSTGLGLALCKAVADAHGSGAVALENAPTGGALFSISFRSPQA